MNRDKRAAELRKHEALSFLLYTLIVLNVTIWSFTALELGW